MNLKAILDTSTAILFFFLFDYRKKLVKQNPLGTSTRIFYYLMRSSLKNVDPSVKASVSRRQDRRNKSNENFGMVTELRFIHDSRRRGVYFNLKLGGGSAVTTKGQDSRLLTKQSQLIHHALRSDISSSGIPHLDGQTEQRCW